MYPSPVPAIPAASKMMLPIFHKARYTPLTETSWPRRPSYVVLLKCVGLAIFVIGLLVVGLHLSGIKQILPITKDRPPPPSEPEEGLLGVARGPEIIVPVIPKKFQTVGVVFYGRRSRVEILDCYLKVSLSLWVEKWDIDLPS